MQSRLLSPLRASWLLVFGLAMARTLPFDSFFSSGILAFLSVLFFAFPFKLGHAGYRPGSGDSANRNLLHLFPVVLLYVFTGFSILASKAREARALDASTAR